MNAPAHRRPLPHSPTASSTGSPTARTRQQFIDNIFAEMCIRHPASRHSLKRSTLHVLIQHPQWLGARFMWADGMREAEIASVDFDVRERPEISAAPPTKCRTAQPKCARIWNGILRSVASTRSMRRCVRRA